MIYLNSCTQNYYTKTLKICQGLAIQQESYFGILTTIHQQKRELRSRNLIFSMTCWKKVETI